MIEKNVTVEIHRNFYKIFPFTFSKWNKELRIAEGTAPSLEKYYKTFERYMRFYTIKDTLDLCDKKNRILWVPIGADANDIYKKLDANNVVYTIVDKTNEFINPREACFEIDEKYQLRDQKQAESIDFLTSERLFHSKMLALTTGTGKTFCAVIAAFKLKMPVLIISETLSEQWCQKILEYTNNKVTVENKKLKLVKGSSAFMNMLNSKKASHGVFYITTSSTLYSVVKTYGAEKVNEVCDFLGIGVKIFDEFHTHWKQNVRIDMAIQTYMTWYLTATPSRTGQSEKSLFYKITKKIPSYGSNTFFERVDINLVHVDYNTYPNEYEYAKCFTSQGLSAVMYWNFIFDKYQRILYVCGILKMIIDNILEKEPDAKILVYLAKLEHINRIKSEFERMYENLDFGNYTTEIEKKRKRYEIRKNVIFTTIGSGGVGLDVDDLQCVISLVPYSSSIIATQMIGRLRAIKDENGNPKELYYYDCIDCGFRTMRHQREKRMAVFGSKAKTTELVQITETDALAYIR